MTDTTTAAEAHAGASAAERLACSAAEAAQIIGPSPDLPDDQVRAGASMRARWRAPEAEHEVEAD